LVLPVHGKSRNYLYDGGVHAAGAAPYGGNENGAYQKPQYDYRRRHKAVRTGKDFENPAAPGKNRV
jgi:hypothetical protein